MATVLEIVTWSLYVYVPLSNIFSIWPYTGYPVSDPKPRPIDIRSKTKLYHNFLD